MADIHNLRQARKAKKRAEAARIAAENRIRFGRTKAERKAAAANAETQARQIDSHKRTHRNDGDEREHG